ncbi:MAG: DNA polymerase III subunit alpha, partial [Candidatus Weimeria sp.]
RGSDGGSLVCYLLGITNLDPIKHGLLFERFLNKERVSMPDIDSDISADTRQKVIEHCKYVYGDKAVCGIMTCTFLAPKGAIDTAAKYYSMYKYKDTDNHFLSLGREMAELVPEEPNTAFKSTVDKNTGKLSCDEGAVTVKDYLNGVYKNNPDALNILKWAYTIEGIFTGYGAHAAGIVITEKGSDVSDVLPLKYNSKLGMMTTQCTKEDVEANGLLKFDFLGLKTLDIISETLFMIQARTGKGIDVLKLDIADKNVYEKIFQTGNTGAVFQFESDGMKKMLKSFKPSCFADLVLLVAAYRPGPMQFLDDIIAVKNGRKEITYLTPKLEPILKNTYGAIIYQEQVMKICQDLAGYSLGGADLVRRAMSKKKAEKLAHERDAFIHGDKERGISGCVANGIPEKVADKIFDQMMDFASYAFNKSHAAAYAYNSYVTAWLKCYYPAEFYAAALNWASDPDKFKALLKDAKSYGIKVLPPDINASEKEFTVENGKIRFALSKIKGVKD